MSQNVKPKSPSERKRERRVLYAVTITPALGTAAAIWHASNHGVSTLDIVLFLAMYVFSGLGISVGYHRLFSHRSYKAGPGVRAMAAVAGSMALQGPVIRWAADHRRHHAFADKDGDPHTPHDRRFGLWRGLWHAHMGWFYDADRTVIRRFAPDLLADSTLKAVDGLYLVWVALSLLIPTAIGLAWTGSWQGGLSALLWGGLAGVFLTHHVTAIVNSVGHRIGSRPFRTRDHAGNNVVFALLTFGEGWHNNHHAFPWSARIGVRPWHVDFGWIAVRAFEMVGLVTQVRQPSAREIEDKAVAELDAAALAEGAVS